MDNSILELTLYGFSIPFVILVCVGWAKTFGLPVKYAPHVSAVVGVVCSILAAITVGKPIIWGLIAGIFLSAIASGIYDQAIGSVKPSVPVEEKPPTE